MTTLSTIKKLSVIAAGATCLSLGAINPAHALSLVNNGSFETGNFSGWTQSSNSNLFNTGVTRASAESGKFGAYFGPVGSKGLALGLSQTLATVKYKSYDLSYFLKNDGGKSNLFSVSVGNTVLLSLKNFPSASDFTEFTSTFIATNASTPLKFAFRQDSNKFRLDNVSVTATAIPTPALLPGLLGLGVGVLRKRKAAATAVEA